MNIKEMKEKYARAGSCWDENAPYCVGGAYCQATGFTTMSKRFPPRITLAEALQEMGGVEKAVAEEAAIQIVKLNDNGEIEAAWQLLEETLEGKS